jgi:hypothetical protein
MQNPDESGFCIGRTSKIESANDKMENLIPRLWDGNQARIILRVASGEWTKPSTRFRRA